MKNSVLAPVIALLAILLVAWGGLFGLTQASPTSSDSSSRTTAWRSGPSTPTQAAPQRSADTADRDGQGLPRNDGSDRSSERRGTTSEDTSRDPRSSDHSDGSTQNALDRLLHGTARGASASDSPATSGDSGGLSNRSAATLIVILLLIAVAGGKAGKRH